MALESTESPTSEPTIDESVAANDRKTITFYIQKEHAELIYNAADSLDVSISSLLRSIIYKQTDGLMRFVPLPDPTPTPGKKWSSGRPKGKKK